MAGRRQVAICAFEQPADALARAFIGMTLLFHGANETLPLSVASPPRSFSRQQGRAADAPAVNSGFASPTRTLALAIGAFARETEEHPPGRVGPNHLGTRAILRTSRHSVARRGR
jgi:hypothetical protein